MSSLADTVHQETVVIDGGLATQLEQQGFDISGDLWSARLLKDDPEAIIDAHRTFFAAGAVVATTASYQASFEGFAAHGIATTEAITLMQRSVALAREAAEEVDNRSTWVAASIGPYGATLADGSEYRGDYDLTIDQLRRFHRPRLQTLAEAEPDVLALETIPCAMEVEALLAEIEEIGLPCWLSLTASASGTRAGEPLSEVYAMTSDVDAVFAVGVNCCAPQDVAASIEVAGQITAKPTIAYPNSGEYWDASGRCWVGDPAIDLDEVNRWVGQGARMIGGCCRVGPSQIQEIAASLTETKPRP